MALVASTDMGSPSGSGERLRLRTGRTSRTKERPCSRWASPRVAERVIALNQRERVLRRNPADSICAKYEGSSGSSKCWPLRNCCGAAQEILPPPARAGLSRKKTHSASVSRRRERATFESDLPEFTVSYTAIRSSGLVESGSTLLPGFPGNSPVAAATANS